MPAKKGNKKRNAEPIDEAVEEYDTDLYRFAVAYLQPEVKSDKRPHPRQAPPVVKCLPNIDLKDLIGCRQAAPLYIMGDPSVEMELAVTLRTAMSACRGTKPEPDDFARLILSIKYLTAKVDIPEFTTDEAVVEALRDSTDVEFSFADTAFVPLGALASHLNVSAASIGFLDPVKSGPCPFGPEWTGDNEDPKARAKFFYAHISCADATRAKSAPFRNFCLHVDSIRLRQNELFAIPGHPLCDPSRCPAVDSYRQLGLKDHHLILIKSTCATFKFYMKALEGKKKKESKTDASDSAPAQTDAKDAKPTKSEKPEKPKKAKKPAKSDNDTESEDDDNKDAKLDARELAEDLKSMDAPASTPSVKPATPAPKPPTAVAAGAVELGATPSEDVKMEPRKSKPVESDDDVAMAKPKGKKRKAVEASAPPAAAAAAAAAPAIADESKGASKPAKSKKQKTSESAAAAATAADFGLNSAAKVVETSLSALQKRIQKAQAAKAASKAAKDEAPAPPPQPSAEENAKRLDIAYGSGAGAAAVAASDDEDVVMLAAPPAPKPASSAPAVAAAPVVVVVAAAAASPAATPAPAPATPVLEPSLDDMFSIDMSDL